MLPRRYAVPSGRGGSEVKLIVNRYSMHIEPENEMEIAYLEEVIGLRAEGSSGRAVRVNAMNLSCFAYLEIGKAGEVTS